MPRAATANDSPLAPMPDANEPATNETDLLREQIARLEPILASPSIKLSVTGGGLPDDGYTLLPEQAVILSREELHCTLNRLRAALATREHLGW